MKPRIVLNVVLSLLALSGGGCTTVKYSALEKVGIHKRDILVDRVEDARVLDSSAVMPGNLVMGGNHVFCTTRMHGDPTRGVVDEDGREIVPSNDGGAAYRPAESEAVVLEVEAASDDPAAG